MSNTHIIPKIIDNEVKLNVKSRLWSENIDGNRYMQNTNKETWILTKYWYLVPHDHTISSLISKTHSLLQLKVKQASSTWFTHLSCSYFSIRIFRGNPEVAYLNLSSDSVVLVIKLYKAQWRKASENLEHNFCQYFQSKPVYRWSILSISPSFPTNISTLHNV